MLYLDLPQIQWLDPWYHPGHTGNISPPAATRPHALDTWKAY